MIGPYNFVQLFINQIRIACFPTKMDPGQVGSQSHK